MHLDPAVGERTSEGQERVNATKVRAERIWHSRRSAGLCLAADAKELARARRCEVLELIRGDDYGAQVGLERNVDGSEQHVCTVPSRQG